jgi:hypothetical protein
MIIGEGQTNQWYIGGLQTTSALTIFICNADSAKEDVKVKIFVILAMFHPSCYSF